MNVKKPKFSVGKTKVVKLTHFHLVRHDFFSININDLVPNWIDKKTIKVQTIKILKVCAKLSHT